MTVAIGLACRDGVLVAADSKATDVATAHNEMKVHVLDGCDAVWTGAGSKYVMEEVGFKLDELSKAHADALEPPSCLCAPDPLTFREQLKATKPYPVHSAVPRGAFVEPCLGHPKHGVAIMKPLGATKIE